MSQGPEDPSLRLVRSIQQGIGREESSRQLFDLHRLRVSNFFARKGFSAEKIPDLTQDVFLRVFKSIDSFRGDSSFKWWLLEIADNVYKNELRRKSADKRDGIEQSLDAPVTKEEDAPSLGDLLPSNTPSPLLEAEQKQQEERMRAAFRDLPPQMLLAVQLRYEKDLKYQEIADRMGISIETVKAHLFQARKRLTAKFGEAGKDKK